MVKVSQDFKSIRFKGFGRCLAFFWKLDILVNHLGIYDYTLKRQAQFIGRLMRDTDPAPIEAYLAKLRGDNTAHNAFLQRVEQARTRLLADDGAITQFMADFPQADAGKLRTLIRNTKKEQEQNKPPKNFRALFQEIKAVMEAGQSDASEEGQDWEE